MTHKLATWVDQFGTSGCVGCGRCITWCPVGIDITEEVARHPRRQEAAMEGLERIVSEHRLFAGTWCRNSSTWRRAARRTCASTPTSTCSTPRTRPTGFYLIRHGRVALEVARPAAARCTFETLGEGDIVGLSWLLPPYRWGYDARAIELVRAIALDAKCLRGKCEADHDLGYELMKRFVPVLVQRLQATRLQLLDVYGPPR